jgi:thiol-disulfide isomerase/thioredoxin
VKKLAIFILTCLLYKAGYSQQDETAGSINKIRQIPAFNILKVPDSTGFTSRQLIKQAPLVLLFFNPDCDHCQEQVKELLAHKNELKQLQIVMVSALPYALIKTFYENYQVASMPNVIMGQDENFALGSIYKPARYPSLYLYDAGGSLAKVFAGNVTAAVLLNAVQ